MPTYNPKAIEPRWQRYWEEHHTFRTPDTSDRPKYYILDMFPYPSGDGLHVGHPEGYTATDILARYRRMCGWNVLHPMGWDAFGLPAEKHAVKTGTHPRITTRQSIDTFRRQIKMLGFSYDWGREVDTTDPNYYKWTQWIFLQIFDTWYDPGQNRGRPIAELPIPPEVKSQGDRAVRKYQDSKRLAYQAEVPVNWCPELGTVLANEEVEDGKSKEEGHPVVRMPLRQWMLRITAYADRLLEDLARVDWSEPIKEMQRNWIGRSEGAEVDFLIDTQNQVEPPDVELSRQERQTLANVLLTAAGHEVKDLVIRVFTTRPDTLFGATYMVLAPEHPLVDRITTPEQRAAVRAYQAETAGKSDRERTEGAKKKSGVFTGAHAVNPVNDERIPIWIADYVLIGYGTGAIMAVPAHDLRDWEFARAFNLPIRPVVQPPVGYQPTREEAALVHEENGQKRYPFTGDGKALNSGRFDGLPTAEFKQQITAWLEERGLGAFRVNYKLRDWLFSRQRYWGEPFPVLHELDAGGNETGVVEPLRADELPLLLPELEDYRPSGRPEPLLGKATDWVYVTRGGKRYKRETNTMPQWAGSCWYYLRYIDARNDQSCCAPARERYWMPVDLYVGGAEHAVLHLLYARFWHKVLFDRGHVHTPEPFMRLVNQGMILGVPQYHISPGAYQAHEALLAARGITGVHREEDGVATTVLMNRVSGANELANLTEEQTEKRQGTVYLTGTEIALTSRADKMSKSRGNVVNPDDVVNEYGADSLRLYEMFMGPLEATKPWSTRGVEGVYRFLGRVWRLIVDDRAEQMQLAAAVQDVPPDHETLRQLHRTIQKVTEDLDGMRFNTAIAAMMSFSNHLTGQEVRPRSVLEPFVLLLSPFAPHIAEELWHALGHTNTLAYEPWPKFDPALTKADTIEVVLQVNGKKRGTLQVPADTDPEMLKELALQDERIKGLIAGKEVRKVIVAPGGRLVNLVIAG